ncbi:hypothetical protein [Aminipila terrae]|uniref:Uncharacterized protein n=1 Tax=Aminipila terrae TaxID=2697030 RepID=A0A6P1MQ37_9FIRM|nr:hypothetical protein [Aminipila terrae]QHI73766.1 hypothetical protein Ami3637_16490 [Aminipila terrae]
MENLKRILLKQPIDSKVLEDIYKITDADEKMDWVLIASLAYNYCAIKNKRTERNKHLV